MPEIREKREISHSSSRESIEEEVKCGEEIRMKERRDDTRNIVMHPASQSQVS